MITVSAPAHTTRKTPSLLTALALVLALGVGIAAGWQVGEHRASSRHSPVPAAAAVVPQVTAPPNAVAPDTAAAVAAAPSAPALAARGGVSEAIAAATASASTALPATAVTVYLVDTQSDAVRLQGIIDDAQQYGELAGSAAILVAGSASDAADANTAVSDLQISVGVDRVQVVDMRTLAPAQ